MRQTPPPRLSEPTVNKTNLALVSLIAALPAGVLAFLLVSTFLSSFEVVSQSGILTVVTGLTLALGSLVTLMPVAIMIFGPKSEKPAKEKPSKASESVVAVAPASGELSEAEMEAADVFSDSEMDVSDAAFEIDEDEVVVADDDMFDEADTGEFDDFEFDDEDEKA